MQHIDHEQERFYTTIAGHYSAIFPFNPQQVAFTVSQAGSVAGRRLLDIGCATGELAFGLAEQGATVTAIDLNGALLARAQQQRSHPRVEYLQANMLHISRLFGRAAFDGVTCYGNTLVHLPDPMHIGSFFNEVFAVLKPGGALLLQILNYDYILNEKLEELPSIDNDEITFTRRYRFSAGSPEIRFVTRLLVKATGETLENETSLFGLGSAALTSLLHDAGFEKITLFAGFNAAPFGGKHLPLVAACRRPE